MIEQDARRAVHLADDHALGAVDDERAVPRHQGHVAHVDVLLLDIEDRAGLGIGIDLEHDQAERHAHRRRVGHAALAAFLGVVLGIFELVIDEIELGGAGEVADREHAAQRLLETRDIADRRIGPQELLVALPLHLDQVRHLHDFVDVAEHLADALLGARDEMGGDGLGGHIRVRPRSFHVVGMPRSTPEALYRGFDPTKKSADPGIRDHTVALYVPVRVSHSSRPGAQGESCPGGGAGGRARVR